MRVIWKNVENHDDVCALPKRMNPRTLKPLLIVNPRSQGDILTA